MLKLKHRTHIRPFTLMTLIVFIITLGVATTSPVIPLFIKQFVQKEAIVGFIITFSIAIALIASLVASSLLNNHHRSKIVKISLIGILFAYIGLIIITNIYQYVILQTIKEVLLAFLWICMGLYVRDISTRRKISKNEGVYYTFANLGYLTGPLIGGFIAKIFNFDAVFTVAAIFILVGYMLFNAKNFHETNVAHKKAGIIANLKSYFKNKNRALIYFVSLGLYIWFGATWLFIVPLALAQHNISIQTIGFTLCLMIVPLIILEVPVCRLSGKIGVKTFFILGFAVIALANILIYFASSVNLLILWFVLSYLGAAFIEPLKEAYFFLSTKQKEESNYFGVFKTSQILGNVIGPLICSFILIFFPFKVISLFFIFIMLFFSILSFRIS